MEIGLGTHQHNFAAEADSFLPTVTPLCVFAAGRGSFDVIVRDLSNDPVDALGIVFEALPLQDNGWAIIDCEIDRVGTSADGFPIWRFTRGT